ncbi:hypothetical protein EC991_001152, partial [Linnemannia zychae]
NPCVAFQAEYATQALLNISDNDTIWQAGFRRGWLVLKGAAGLAKMPDPREIKDTLEGLENLFKAGKGAARMLKNTWVAAKTGENFEFSAKEGLKFKRIWYPTLRNAEEYIQTGNLIGFQELVATAPYFDAAKILQAMLQQQNPSPVPLSNPCLHPGYNTLFHHSSEDATSTSTLLRIVQNKKQDEIQLAELYSHIRPSNASLEKIQSALKTHYSSNLKILRISGEDLDIDTCFINLAIVEAPAQRKKEKKELKELAAVFHRIPSSETVRGSNIKSSIRLGQLFDRRRLRDDKEGVPHRILVQGRAGIGKTTLCKKIVHLHQSGLWADQFEAVLWLPLRRLRDSTCRTLESLLREKVSTSQLDREHQE